MVLTAISNALRQVFAIASGKQDTEFCHPRRVLEKMSSSNVEPSTWMLVGLGGHCVPLAESSMFSSGFFNRLRHSHFLENTRHHCQAPFSSQTLAIVSKWLSAEALNNAHKRQRVEFQFTIDGEYLLELLLAADYLEIEPLFELGKRMLLANLSDVDSLEGLTPDILNQIVSSATLEQLSQMNMRGLCDTTDEFNRRVVNTTFPVFEEDENSLIFASQVYLDTGQLVDEDKVTKVQLPCNLYQSNNVTFASCPAPVSGLWERYPNLTRVYFHFSGPKSTRLPSLPSDVLCLKLLDLRNCHLDQEDAVDLKIYEIVVHSKKLGLLPRSATRISASGQKLSAAKFPPLEAFENLSNLNISGNRFG